MTDSQKDTQSVSDIISDHIFRVSLAANLEAIRSRMSIHDADTLLSALSDYLRAIHEYPLQSEQPPYSFIEIPKIAIADALLRELDFPLSPRKLTVVKQKPVKNPRSGFVYLMRNRRNGYTKIGFSSRPQIREKCLQSEEPEVHLLWSAPGTTRDEIKLHALYAEFRVRGEWFNLTEVHIAEITA